MAWMLAAALMFSNLEGAAFVNAEGENNTPIEIANAQDLQKIGSDADYPMSGDYLLTADIDLSGMGWEPMGGYIGVKGTCNPAEANVFSGTFDGQGHVISGLTIDLAGSIAQENKYGQVGLFSVIGSNDATDYAEVKNLIFTDVNIRTDFEDGLAAAGTLAGEVNGYATVSGIAVLDGTLTVNPSAACDTVGAGGIIGECRTSDAMANRNVSVTDCYNGADVFASGSRQDLIYAAGIIGRVAQSECKEISGCINTGIVQYEGYDAFAIAAAQNGTADYLRTLSNCYFPSSLEQLSLGGVTAVKDQELMSGTLPANFSADKWQAVAGYYPVPAICLTSNAAGRVYLSSLALTFAEGESAAGVKAEIILPQTAGEEKVTWSSNEEAALSIEEGKAVAHPDHIGMNTAVILTAQTAKGYSRTFKVVVLFNNEQVASFLFNPESDANYAQVGTPLTVSVSNLSEGMELNYQWSVDKQVIAHTGKSYTPTEDDLEKFISVTVSAKDSGLSWKLSTYCSELPVVYVETEDGKGINSNTVAKDATIKIQGNDEFNDSTTWYSGEFSYQWYANGSKLTGATKNTYLLTAADVDKKITVEVTSSIETGKITGSYGGSVIAKPIKATGITLSVKSKKMYAYQTLQLKATVSPRGASQNVEYISNKRGIADVSATGKITAKAPGVAKITVRAKDGSGVSAVCTVTVQKPVIKISGKTSVKRKKTITLTAKTYGLKGTVKWKLDTKGRKLLKLNKSKGNKVKLTAKNKTGKAKLTITCGKKKVTKTIRVKK